MPVDVLLSFHRRTEWSRSRQDEDHDPRTILSDLATVLDLNELVCSLNALEDHVRSDVTGHKLDAHVDTTSPPTFGGPEPRDTRDIWSWDAEMFLRNANGRWFLERRDDLELAA